MSATLFIRCLGIPAVFAGGARLVVPRSGLQLLLFLCLSPGRRVLRDEIVEALWPETAPEKAAPRLRSALWRLRRALAAAEADAAVEALPDGALRLSLGPRVTLDIDALQVAGAGFLADEAALDLPAAFTDGAGCASRAFQGWYTPWALRERVRLENLCERCLRTLFRRQSDAGRHDAAIETGGRLLEIDPLLEDVHEALITLFLALGQPGRAKRQLDACTALLRAELDVTPSPRLRASIEAAGAALQAEPAPAPEPAPTPPEPIPSRALCATPGTGPGLTSGPAGGPRRHIGRVVPALSPMPGRIALSI